MFKAQVPDSEHVSSCLQDFLLYELALSSTSSLTLTNTFGFDLGISFLYDSQAQAGLPYLNTSSGLA